MKKLWMAFLSIFAGSLAIRFWGLNRFNTLVFDEVYFAKYGFSYLKQIPFFDVHPPFGKYFIALGIWLHAHFMGGLEAFQNAATVEEIDAFAYRWANGVVGTTIPILVGAIAYQITRQKRYAILASVFVALDGLVLVESRYGLINVYLLAFGLLGVLAFLKSLTSARQTLWMMASGACLGGCASVKWNGLGFLLGIYLLYGGAWALQSLKSTCDRRFKPSDLETESSISGDDDANPQDDPTPPDRKILKNPLRSILEIDRLDFAIHFALVPFLVYRLLWIPHLQLNTDFTFAGMQWQILTYHESIGNTAEAHPYCSTWYSWPWMVRPVGYYFEAVDRGLQTIVFDVHAFGNPPLWWLSAFAIAGVTFQFVRQGIDGVLNRPMSQTRFLLHSVLVCQFVANFLPWAKVSRCTYIYHYMAASLFSFMALAWWVDRALSCRDRRWRILGSVAIAIVVLGFWYWLPIYLGLPLTREAFDARMWFRSWY